jgi:nicotinate-nucleotide adenylyltransferase
MRIGILGGTFNPIHIGHLILAEEARRLLKLDRVIFVPCYLPPHKSAKGVISALSRFEMVKEAIKSHRGFVASDIEIRARKKSYTFLTLEKLRRRFSPPTVLFLIIGSDATEELSRWRNFTRILELARIVIAERPGFPVESKPVWSRLIRIPQLAISSSDIRRRIKEGLSIRYLVPGMVEKYIASHRLYLK